MLKSKFKKVLAIAMSAAIMALSFSGCVSQPMNKKESEPYRKGYWAENTFVSRYTDLLFNLPENWSKFSAEDIENLGAKMGISDGVVYDMAVTSPKGESVMMLGEDLTKIENGTELKEKEYAESIAENLKKSTDYTYTTSETEKVKLLGKEYVKFEATVKDGTIEKTQWYVTRRIDDNMFVLILTGDSKESVEKMAEFFQKYDDVVNMNGYGTADDGKEKVDVKLRKGKWSEDSNPKVFVNESMGIKFTAKDNWTAYTQDELNALSGNSGSEDKDDGLTMADGYNDTSVFDFGIRTEKGSSVVMLIEDLDANDLTKNINERGYVEMLEDNLKQTDLKYEFADAEEISIGSRTFLNLKTKIADGSAHQWYMMERIDAYMVTVIVTASDENVKEIDEIMAAFSAL